MERTIAHSIINYLQSQIDDGKVEKELEASLTVAIQCLEEVYSIPPESSKDSGAPCLYDLFDKTVNRQKNPETAENHKKLGNDHMKTENYELALKEYSLAIEHDSSNYVCYCNRAAAYHKLGKYREAMEDALMSVSIEPTYAKAHARVGTALMSLNDYHRAHSYLKKALELEPTSESFRGNLATCEEKMNTEQQQQPQPSGQNPFGGIDQNAFLNLASSIMQNPQMRDMMEGFASNLMNSQPNPSASSTSAPSAGPTTATGQQPQAATAPGNLDFSSLMNAAQQALQQNPDAMQFISNMFNPNQQPSQPRNGTP